MASTHASYIHNQHRMEERLTLAATATLNGHDFAIRDWSFGGFSIDNVQTLSLLEGEVHNLIFSLPFNHYTARCSLRAEVRYVDARQARFEFQEIDPNVRMLMRDYVHQTLHHDGNNSAARTTQSAAEIASPRTSVKVQTRTEPGRWVALLLTGLALIAVGAWVLQSQRSLVSTQAELVGNTVEIRARTEGYIEKIHIRSGSDVQAGQLLMELDATEARRNLAAAGYLHRQLERAVKTAEQAMDEEQKRSALFSRIARGRERIEETREQEAQIALTQAESDLQRAERMVEGGYIAPAGAEGQRAVALQRRVQAMRSKTESMLAREVAQEAEKGRFFTENQVSNKLGEILIQVEQRRTELAQALVGIGPLLAKLEGTSLRAPDTGKVRVINRSRGELVREGELVAVIETRAEPNILAKFTHSDAMRLSPGQTAQIEFPALGVHLTGRIEAIGWQGLVVQGATSPVAETGVGEIPATITLDGNIPVLPSGVRARVIVDTKQSLLTILRQRMP